MNIGDYNFYYDLQTKIDTDVEGRTHVFSLKIKGWQQEAGCWGLSELQNPF